jgi:hypothetical protein
MKTKSFHTIFITILMVVFLVSSVGADAMPAGQGSAQQAVTNSVQANAVPTLGNCLLFPANNYWNTPVDNLPIHESSDAWINSIGRTRSFHMDFGSGTWDGGPIGIPYNVVEGNSMTKSSVNFYYPSESDPGPFPIPANPKIEHGSDHHILIVDSDDCQLYEIYDAWKQGSQWYGGSGAIWDLSSNDLRHDTWTSADAAGLPILPGLARYEEVAAGVIGHALRFTTNCTANYYIWPARHKAQSGSCANPVPFGARFRLKADYDISGYSPQAQVILQAMKTYGIVLADNGSPWYVSGAPNEGWNNTQLRELRDLTGNDFEAVDTSVLKLSNNSAGTIHNNWTQVMKITRMSANPTNAATVQFKVVFSRTVSGVDETDFALTTSSASSAALSGISGSGNIYIVTVDTGEEDYNGTLRLDVIDDDSIVDEDDTPLGDGGAGNGDFTTGQVYTIVKNPSAQTFASLANYDGWVLESSETSGKGGSLNKGASVIRIGDDSGNRQYRGILHFNTSSLPDEAVIYSITLRIKRQGVTGTNPFKTHGGLLVDIREGGFGSSPALQLSDFKAKASNNSAGAVDKSSVGGWHSVVFGSAPHGYINRTGVTQFRLRFKKNDNNDFGADFLRIYSGNAGASNIPQLMVEYYVQ